MDPTTHRFQPMLDLDDEWFIVDTVPAPDTRRTNETFPRDTAIILCWGLEDQPSRVADFTWMTWPDV